MTLQFNGREVVLAAPMNVAALLDHMGMAGQRLAVERNRELVPRRHWEQVAVAEGDRIEVVELVGGG